MVLILTILSHYCHWSSSAPSILMEHFQPINFNNLNHEAAFRNITAILFFAATIISGLTNCFFYTKNEGWFLSSGRNPFCYAAPQLVTNTTFKLQLLLCSAPFTIKLVGWWVIIFIFACYYFIQPNVALS